MKKATPKKKAAPVRKAAAKRPTSPIAVPLKKSAARKSNVVAARRVLSAERKEQSQPMAKEAGNVDELNAAQEDKEDHHQPTAERPAPTYDPTPDTNVPMRGQTAVRGTQTARVAANKSNRARIGNHRKH